MLERITRRSVFRRFAHPAPRFCRGPFTVVVAERGAEEGAAAGVATAIGRRVGPAVVRNRLRRQVRSILADVDRERPMRPGWYLVIVSPGARGRSYAELTEDLRRAFDRADGR